jgi:hypothetical protein
MDNKPKKDLERISVIHLYICKKLSENFSMDQPISYKTLIYHITRMTYHMPRKYDDIIIKELIDIGFLNKIYSGRSPTYKLYKKDYESLINDLNKIKNSTQRFKILKSKYEKLLRLIEKEEIFEQKYNLLKCDFEKLLRKLELKKIEGSHYW